MKIGELLMDLGFNADTMKLRDFAKNVGDLNMKSILTAGSFGAVYNIAKNMVDTAQDLSHEFNKFGRETGESRIKLQQWAAVAEKMGVNVGTLVSGIMTLQQGIFDLNFGKNTQSWERILGEDDPRTHKDIFETLLKIAEAFEGMDIQMQRYHLRAINLSDEWLNILPHLKEAKDEFYLSEKHLDRMQEHQERMVELSHNVKILWADIGAAMTPAVNKAREIAISVTEVLHDSKEWHDMLGSVGDKLERGDWMGLLFGLIGKTAEGYSKIWDWSRAHMMIPSPLSPFNPRLSEEDIRNLIRLRPNINASITVQSNDPEAAGQKTQKHIQRMMDDVDYTRPRGVR